MSVRRYRYVGPLDFLAAVRPASEGQATCHERNLAKDDDFRCALCGAELPARWNLGPPGDGS